MENTMRSNAGILLESLQGKHSVGDLFEFCSGEVKKIGMNLSGNRRDPFL